MGRITGVQGRLDLVEIPGRYGKPRSLTEVSGRKKGASERESADHVARSVAGMGANPGLAGLSAYELPDEPYFGGAGESHYGLAELARGRTGMWEVARRMQAIDA